MLNSIKNQANALTENGAATFDTTQSDCLDLFATIGAIRRQSDKNIENRFMRAFAEDKNVAIKLLFFARDIRGGLGERKVFRVILRWLAQNHPDSLVKNLAYVSEYGRFDDLLSLIGTPCEKQAMQVLCEQFASDVYALEHGGEVSLLAKWLPSENASNRQTICNARVVAKAFGMTAERYRKTLVALRKHISIIENNLRQKDYTFDYAKQPSKAMYKYRSAFLRNDNKRSSQYIQDVSNGRQKLHADTLAPYELVDPYLDMDGGFCEDISVQEKQVLNATWDSLPDYAGDENALVVIDTSGSMYFASKPKPASVALSLGIYFAERNKGCFKNTFIEFSSRPRLITIKGKTFADKLRYVASFNDLANTNIEAVFKLVLDSAVKNNLSAQDLPKRLIIISDMEFDSCVHNAGKTNFQNAKDMFAEHGYTLPDVVFWNVASRKMQQPVTKNEQGVVLVSGCTPRLFEMVASANTNPYDFMMEVVSNERYSQISA